MHKFLTVGVNLIASLVLAASSFLVGHAQSENSQPLLTYTLQDYDASGKLINRQTRESHSYLLGFVFIEWQQMSQTSYGTFTDINNTGRSATFGYNTMLITASPGVTNTGIVAGTGTNAIAQTNYALQTLIAHGTGSGQLSYSGESFTDPAVVGNVTSWTTSRTLTNNSGGDITIREIGVYWTATGTGTSYYTCAVRDLVAGGQTVANGHNLVITYTFATTH